MEAILLSTKVASESLSKTADSDSLLAVIFNTIPDARRVNYKSDGAVKLLSKIEEHFTRMGIPYLLSIYEVFLRDIVELLHANDHKPLHMEPVDDKNKISLEIGHEYIAESCNSNFDSIYLSLFHLVRQIRNRIIHQAGTSGSNLENKNIPKEARQLWEGMSHSSLVKLNKDGRLLLGSGELRASLAIVNHLARDVNGMVISILSRENKTELVVDDFLKTHSIDQLKLPQILRLLKEYNYGTYRSFTLSESELNEVLNAKINKSKV